MKDFDLARMMTPTGATAALASDAARVFSGVDVEGVASIAKTLGGMDAKRLANVSAMRDASKALAFARPIVAPQAAAGIANAFRAIQAKNRPFTEAMETIQAQNRSFTEAMKAIQGPTFRFAKTLDDLKVARQFPPGVADAFKALQMPPGYTTGIREALAVLPPSAISGVASQAASAVSQAAVIADTPAATEVAEPALIDLDDLSPIERQELQKDVADAIAALGTLVAILAENGRLELASATLAFLAILVSIYWRVTGKLDE